MQCQLELYGRGLLRSTHVLSGGVPLEIRLDRLVLLVEQGQVGDKVLDDIGMGERVDLGVRGVLGGNSA